MHETVPTAHARSTFFGALLCRLIVPLWVLAGASFKLYERNPANLPSGIRATAKSMGWENLDTLLRVLIGCELFAVAVMILLPRFARAMALFMLSSFCAILIWEIARQATKCGCFGSLPMKPWHMLVIDGTLLVLTIVFRYSSRVPANASAALGGAAALAALGMAVAVSVPNPPAKQQTVMNVNDDGPPPPSPNADGPQPPTNATQPSNEGPQPPSTQNQGAGPQPGPQPAPPSVGPTPPSQGPTTASTDPTINPNPKPLPSSWYTQEMETWIAKPWRDLDIFQLMPRWPRDMDKGKRYIVFYSRTCEHCKQMLDEDLLTPLDGLITLVQVPASRTLLTDPAGWPMPPHVETTLKAELLDLPLGPNWIITTPLVIAVKDGKVTCATEGEHKKCLGLE